MEASAVAAWVRCAAAACARSRKRLSPSRMGLFCKGVCAFWLLITPVIGSEIGGGSGTSAWAGRITAMGGARHQRGGFGPDRVSQDGVVGLCVLSSDGIGKAAV